MAVYKVPQNVEAEDKLLGPFTFRQFIYLIAAGVGILIAWLLSKASIYTALIPVPFILLFGFLGFYHREDQPVEAYLLAALNYFIKPRRRLWDNEGIVERVHLEAPKRMAPPKPKNLSTEHGQLEWLAHIMDTRGWSIKRPELTEPLANQDLAFDDRLVLPIVPAASQEPLDVRLSDDVMDSNNPKAERFNELAEEASQIARRSAIAKMQAALAKPPVVADAAPKPVPKIKGAAKADTPLPSHIEFDPFPQAITQKMIDPKTGKFAMMRKQIVKATPKTPAKPTQLDHNLAPHNPAAHAFKRLASNDTVPISEIAKQAKIAQAVSLNQGQEISLHALG